MSTLTAARQIWANANPSIVATPGEGFLNECGLFRSSWPACLRFAANLKHPSEQFFPALIVQATNARTGAATGSIQRLFLGHRKGKAEVEKKQQKMSLGPMKGTVARLAEHDPKEPLTIGEGVTTVLSVMQATDLPGWATFGTSGLKDLGPSLPDDVKWAVLLGENDVANEKALAAVVPVLKARGVRVDVVHPPPGLKDFNDLVNGTSGHTPEAGLALIKQIVDRAISAAAPDEDSPIEIEASAAEARQASQFSLTDTGLYRRKDEKWQWVAQPFEVLGLARDVVGADWGRLIRFRNPDGGLVEEIVSAAALHGEAGGLIGRLAHLGMNIKGTLVARRSFAEYLLSVEPPERVTIARRVGWLKAKAKLVFILPDEIIGDGAGEQIILAKEAGGAYGRCGTLDDWRDRIAKPASL
jgi:hypothetical protein